MRSQFAEYLDKMQKEADKDNLIIAARHYDILDYYFHIKLSPEEAYTKYKIEFLPRWNAITQNGKFTDAS